MIQWLLELGKALAPYSPFGPALTGSLLSTLPMMVFFALVYGIVARVQYGETASEFLTRQIYGCGYVLLLGCTLVPPIMLYATGTLSGGSTVFLYGVVLGGWGWYAYQALRSNIEQRAAFWRTVARKLGTPEALDASSFAAIENDAPTASATPNPDAELDVDYPGRYDVFFDGQVNGIHVTIRTDRRGSIGGEGQKSNQFFYRFWAELDAPSPLRLNHSWWTAEEIDTEGCVELDPDQLSHLSDRQRSLLREHFTIWVEEAALGESDASPHEWLPPEFLEMIETYADTYPITLTKRGVQYTEKKGIDDEDPDRTVRIIRTLVEAARSMPS